MHKQTKQMEIDDPLGFPADRAFAAEVARLVGKSYTSAPHPEWDFNPIRSGGLKVSHLRLVDGFGRIKDIDPGRGRDAGRDGNARRAGPRHHPPPDPAGAVELPMAAGRRRGERGRPQAVGLADRRLARAGQPRRQPPGVRRRGPPARDHQPPGRRRTNPGGGGVRRRRDRQSQPMRACSAASSPRPQIRRSSRPSWRRSSRPWRTSTPRASAAHRPRPDDGPADRRGPRLAQPRAQGRAGGPSGVEQLPPRPRACRAIRDTDGFTRVAFPVRVGEFEQFNDGLVGYWVEPSQGDGFVDDRFVAPQGTTAGHRRVLTHGDDPPPSRWRSTARR